jgi:hypothetical protein
MIIQVGSIPGARKASTIFSRLELLAFGHGTGGPDILPQLLYSLIQVEILQHAS